ncbi:MAG: 50S ribosomal protein L11 methyltransferase [Bacteroidales bacterium]
MKYTEAVFKIDPPDPGREIIMAELAEVGFESFEYTDDGLKGWAPEEAFSLSAVNEIAERYASLCKVTFTYGDITPVNWNEEWEKNYAPVVIDGRCGIRAPFHPPFTALDFDIVIEPKMSFGTAHHSTTALMTGWLLDMDLKGKTVLDMGCGTGVLAILAALKGAGKIVAIDNYIWAYENTVENCARNGAGHIKAIHGDVTALRGMENQFDLILANINRNVLLDDMGAYAACLRPDGMLLMSGFFAEDEEALRQQADAHGLEFLDSRHQEQWSSVLTRRRIQ